MKVYLVHAKDSCVVQIWEGLHFKEIEISEGIFSLSLISSLLFFPFPCLLPVVVLVVPPYKPPFSDIWHELHIPNPSVHNMAELYRNPNHRPSIPSYFLLSQVRLNVPGKGLKADLTI